MRPVLWRRIDAHWWLVLPIVAVIGFFYVIPLFNALLLSVTDPKPGIANYVRLVTTTSPRRVLTTTLVICLITTLIAVLLAYCVSYVMANARETHRRILLVGVLIPLWISVLIRSMSWLVLLRENGPINTWLMDLGIIDAPIAFVRNETGVVIGMTHYLLPYAVLPIYAAMRDIDQRLLFASRSLGAGAWRTFFKVYLPLSLPGVLAASVVVFVFGLGFYVTPAILGAGRVVMMAESISVEILQTLRWGVGAAQSVFLLVITLILVRLLAKTVGLRKGFSS